MKSLKLKQNKEKPKIHQGKESHCTKPIIIANQSVQPIMIENIRVQNNGPEIKLMTHGCLKDVTHP